MTSAEGIIIRGAPGVGKTEASRRLAARFPMGTRIEVDALRAMVVSVDWTNQAEHIAVLSLAAGLVLGFIEKGYKPVVVVDTFSGNKLTAFLADLVEHRPDLDVRSFALVATQDVLRSRVMSRPPNRFKDVEICEKLNADVVEHLLPVERLIDTSALTPEATAEAIHEECTRR